MTLPPQDLEAPKTTATNQSGYRVLNRKNELVLERGLEWIKEKKKENSQNMTASI